MCNLRRSNSLYVFVFLKCLNELQVFNFFFFIQIEGAFIQGVGLYTLEEIYFSPEGEQLTLSPDTYKIPAVCDIPEQFHVYLLPNSCNSIAIYSSKVGIPNLVCKQTRRFCCKTFSGCIVWQMLFFLEVIPLSDSVLKDYLNDEALLF